MARVGEETRAQGPALYWLPVAPGTPLMMTNRVF